MNIQDIIKIAPVSSFIFLATLISSFIAFQRPELSRKWMLNPYSFVHEKKYFQVISSGFIHADWMHLIFNMLSFYFFALDINGGVPLEYMMTSAVGQVGHLYFGLIYFASMALGDLSTIIKQKDNPKYYSLGASGAITGVVFSFILFAPDSRLSFFFMPNMPAPLFAVLFVVFSIIGGKSRRTNINHDAHLWGGLVGFIMTIILFPGILQNFIAALPGLFHF